MDLEEAVERIGAGSAIILVGVALGSILEYGVKVLLARILGPDSYGVFVQGLAVVQVVAVVAVVGLHRSLPRFLSYYAGRDEEERQSDAVVTAFVVAAVGGAAGTAVMAGTAADIAALFREPLLGDVLTLMAMAVLPLSLFYVGVGTLRGLQDARHKVLVADVLLPVVEIGLILAAARYGFGLSGMVVAYIGAVAVAALATFLAVRRLDGSLFRSRTLMPRQLLLFSWPLIIVSVMTVVNKWIDVLMLGWLVESAQVGVYEVALAVSGLMLVFLSSVNYMFMPVISELTGAVDRGRIREVYGTVARWLILLTLPLVVGFLLFPAQVLTLLFGAEYVGGTVALRILTLGYFYWVAVGPAGMVLIALDMTERFMVAMVALGVVDVVLNLLLIPRYGLAGAAVAMTAGMVVANTILLAYVRGALDGIPHTVGSLRPFLAMLPAAAGAAAVTVAVAPGPLGSVVLGAALTATYLLIARRVGAVTADDVDMVRNRL